MPINIEFNYDNAEIVIENYTNNVIRIKAEDHRDETDIPPRGRTGFTRPNKVCDPVAIMHWLIQHEYAADIDIQNETVEDYADSIGLDTSALRKALSLLNEKFESKGIHTHFQIQVDGYESHLKRSINELDIVWKYRYGDNIAGKRRFEQYQIGADWTSETRRTDIKTYKEQLNEERTIIDAANYADSHHLRTYNHDYHEKSVTWEPYVFKDTISNLHATSSIDTKILPNVKTHTLSGGKDCGILKEYVEKRLFASDNNVTIAFVEGQPGAGKTSSLKNVVANIGTTSSEGDGNVVIFVKTTDLIDTPLFEHIRDRYLHTNRTDASTMSKVAEIVNIDSRRILIIIDGWDEVSCNTQWEIAYQIKRLWDSNPSNLYYIITSRNVNAIEELREQITGRRRKQYEKVYLQPLNDEQLAGESKEIKDLLKRHTEFRIPLFVSFLREIQKMQKGEISTNLKSYTGKPGNDLNNADKVEIKKISDIKGYYDLFNIRWMLLLRHAERTNVNTLWYTHILTMAAYYLISGKEKRGLEATDIGDLFEEPWVINKKEKKSEYDWCNLVIIEGNRFPEFKDILGAEKFEGLLNTGQLQLTDEKYNDDKSTDIYNSIYDFEHIEYKRFLAGKFAALIVRECDDDSIIQGVLDKIIEKTSYNNDDDNSQSARIDKMRYISFAYYFFMDYAAQNRDEGKRKGISMLDCKLLQIAANISYERRDVWQGAEPIISKFIDYYTKVLTPGSGNRNKIAENWQYLDAINVIAYENISINPDQNKLNRIKDIFNVCTVSVVVREATLNINEVTNMCKANDIECYHQDDAGIVFSKLLRDLIYNNKKRKVLGRDCPVDFDARIISNLGAVNQAIARKNRYEKQLSIAKELHTIACEIREKLISEGNTDVSLIRSLVTLATDSYYEADFCEIMSAPQTYDQMFLEANRRRNRENFRSVQNSLKSSRDYYLKALKRQGVRYVENLAELNYEKSFEVLFDKDMIVEIPQPDAEPHVIFPRIAGGYYLEYTKAKEMNTNYDYQKCLKNQFDNLKAAYIFLRKACESKDHNCDQTKIDDIKLDINSKYINDLFKDVENKYMSAFSEMISNKDQALDLLQRINSLHKKLNPGLEIDRIIVDDTGKIIMEKQQR